MGGGGGGGGHLKAGEGVRVVGIGIQHHWYFTRKMTIRSYNTRNDNGQKTWLNSRMSRGKASIVANVILTQNTQ